MSDSTHQRAPRIQPPKTGIPFADLPWNLNLPREHQYIRLTTNGEWNDGHVNSIPSSLFRYETETLPFSPATSCLNYGVTVWEGIKCYRIADDKAVVFRADQNWARMCYGAEQMCLPPPSKKMFLRAIQVAIQENSALIPPVGAGMKLYIRPLLVRMYLAFMWCSYVLSTNNTLF
jgi:hypothetical protein